MDENAISTLFQRFVHMVFKSCITTVGKNASPAICKTAVLVISATLKSPCINGTKITIERSTTPPANAARLYGFEENPS